MSLSLPFPRPATSPALVLTGITRLAHERGDEAGITALNRVQEADRAGFAHAFIENPPSEATRFAWLESTDRIANALSADGMPQVCTSLAMVLYRHLAYASLDDGFTRGAQKYAATAQRLQAAA